MPLYNPGMNPLAGLIQQMQARGPAAGPAPAALPDLNALTLEGARLSRREKLAQALTQMATQDPGQMVSGYYVAPNKLGQIARLAGALGGAYAGHGVAEKQLDLASRQQDARQKIIDAMAGGNEQALRTGLASQDEQVNALALAERKAMQSRIPGEGDLEAKFTPESIAAYRSKTGPLVPIEDKFVQMGKSPYGGYVQKNVRTGKIEIEGDRSPGTTVNVGDKASLKWIEEVAPMLKDANLKGTAAVQSIAQADLIEKAITAGAFTGPVGDIQQFLLRAGNAIVPDADNDAKLAAGQELISGLANLTLEGRKAMRGEGAITEQEGKLAEAAKSGKRTLSPAELRTLARAARRSGKFFIAQNNKYVQALPNLPGGKDVMPFYELIDMPPEEPPIQPTAPRVSREAALQELRRRGVKVP